MRLICLVLLVIFASLAFATSNNGCNPTGSSVQLETKGTDAVSISVINSFEPGEQALGLDFYQEPGYNLIVATSTDNSHAQAYEINGSLSGIIPLDPTNTNCFGIVFNDVPDTPVYHTNDWVISSLYTTDEDGFSWTTSANPAGSSGRGMDFDGTDYWQADGMDLVRFQPGVGSETVTVPGMQGQISGLTTFPYGDDLGIALAVYQTHNLFFYKWNGSSLSYLGSASCPGSSITLSYGLTYNPATGNMHWSYSNSSDTYHIVEFSFTITSLERSSWGSIKSSF